jgi:hypothetical protein
VRPIRLDTCVWFNTVHGLGVLEPKASEIRELRDGTSPFGGRRSTVAD